VPIVEPEVTLGPGSYSIQETAFWSERVYSHVFRLLDEYKVESLQQSRIWILTANNPLTGLRMFRKAQRCSGASRCTSHSPCSPICIMKTQIVLLTQ